MLNRISFFGGYFYDILYFGRSIRNHLYIGSSNHKLLQQCIEDAKDYFYPSDELSISIDEDDITQIKVVDTSTNELLYLLGFYPLQQSIGSTKYRQQTVGTLSVSHRVALLYKRISEQTPYIGYDLVYWPYYGSEISLFKVMKLCKDLSISYLPEQLDWDRIEKDFNICKKYYNWKGVNTSKVTFDTIQTNFLTIYDRVRAKL